jgi:AcrR family transcriptional regulator
MRQDPKDRRKEILAAALRMSVNYGYQRVTRADIAGAAKCSEALVSHYFSTMVTMRRAIMREAIAKREYAIVAQGLAMADRQAQKAPQTIRDGALASMAFLGMRR